LSVRRAALAGLVSSGLVSSGLADPGQGFARGALPRQAFPQRTARRPALLGLAAFALALFGAGSPRPAVAAQPDRLSVAMNPYLSFAPFIIAQAEGSFAKHGIDVELVDLRRSSLWLAPLIRGDLDVGAGPVTPGLFNAIARGAGVRIVAGKEYFDPDADCAFQGIVVSRALASSGDPHEPPMLLGRRLSMDRDTIYGYWLDRLMESAGYKADAVETVAYPAAAELEATISGQLDAFSAGEPWLQRALVSGEVVLAHAVKDTLPRFQPGVIVFGPSLLEGDPDLGRRFLLGYLEGVQKYREGKTPRNLELVSDYMGVDKEILARACWPTFAPDGQLNAAPLADFQSWMKERGLVDEELDTERFWNGRFLPAEAPPSGE